MALATTAPRIVGNKVRLFREGASFTLPSAGTASAAALPGTADTGWIDVGCVMEGTVTPTSTDIEVSCPSPGAYRLDKVLVTDHKLKLELTLQYLGPLGMELAFDTAALTNASTTYTPNSGLERNFWVELKQYDHNDVLINTVSLFCYVKLAGGINFNKQLTETKIECLVLQSALNAGTL